jgi:hypothetical protein
MNQSFPCKYGSILQENKNLKKIGSFFGVLVAAWTTRKKRLGQHNLFKKDLVKK